MGKQVGPTPITAKLKRTTKGGIVQPQLKTLQSPAQKALVGKQHNLPQHLKAKIEAAPESPAKQTGRKRVKRTDSLNVKPERRGSGDRARAKSRARGKTNITQTKQPGSKDPNFGVSPSSRMPVSQPVPELLKGPSKPPKQTKKKETKPKQETKPKKETKPKQETTPKKENKSQTTKKPETSIKASKLRAKGEKALAEGKIEKAGRLRKRYDRKTKRDKRKAERKEKRSIRKNEISKLLQ